MMIGRGFRSWRLLAPALVVALGAGTGRAFLVASAVRPAPRPVDRTPVPLAGHEPCDDVTICFGTDEQMTRAAASFHDDPDARLVFVETKPESFVRLRAGFKDHPEVLRGLGGEESSAAVVTVVPLPGTDVTASAARLKTRFPAAQGVPLLRPQRHGGRRRARRPRPEVPAGRGVPTRTGVIRTRRPANVEGEAVVLTRAAGAGLALPVGQGVHHFAPRPPPAFTEDEQTAAVAQELVRD